MATLASHNQSQFYQGDAHRLRAPVSWLTVRQVCIILCIATLVSSCRPVDGDVGRSTVTSTAKAGKATPTPNGSALTLQAKTDATHTPLVTATQTPQVNADPTHTPQIVATPTQTPQVVPQATNTPDRAGLALEPDEGDYELPNDEAWKPLNQIQADLEMVVEAGYLKIALFDLKSLKSYPDERYIALVREYVQDGLEVVVYAQEVNRSQRTLDVLDAMGVSGVIVWEQDLMGFLSAAGFETIWWASVGYPSSHDAIPTYRRWPDLRQEDVRQDLADWAVQVPDEIDRELSLDYIRWNRVDNERTAEQVTDLLQRIRDQWDRTDRGILTAAVYPYLGRTAADGGALSVGQRWDEWLDKGLVDYVYPMAYSSEDTAWLIDEWEKYDRERIIPALSVIEYYD